MIEKYQVLLVQTVEIPAKYVLLVVAPSIPGFKLFLVVNLQRIDLLLVILCIRICNLVQPLNLTLILLYATHEV